MQEVNTRGTEIFPMNEPIKGRKKYSRLHGLPLVVAAVGVGLAAMLGAPKASEPGPTPPPAVVERDTTPVPVTEPPITPAPVTEPPVSQPPVSQPPVTQPPVTPAPVTEPPVTPYNPYNPYVPPVTRPPVTTPPTTPPAPTYTKPALNSVSARFDDETSDLGTFYYSFVLKDNDADLDKGVTAVLQVRNAGDSAWDDAGSGTYKGGSLELGYDADDIEIPDDEIGVVQEVQFKLDYTLTDGSTTGTISSWDEGKPLYAYAGEYMYPGQGEAHASGFFADFPVDTELLSKLQDGSVSLEKLLEDGTLTLTGARLIDDKTTRDISDAVVVDVNDDGTAVRISGLFENILNLDDEEDRLSVENGLFLEVTLNYKDSEKTVDWSSDEEARLMLEGELPWLSSRAIRSDLPDGTWYVPFSVELNDLENGIAVATLYDAETDQPLLDVNGNVITVTYSPDGTGTWSSQSALSYTPADPQTEPNRKVYVRVDYTLEDGSYSGTMTSATMTRQANRPDRKAARNPRQSESPLTEPLKKWPVSEMLPTMSRNCSPMIGTRTIKKENWAMTSRRTPVIRPVAMVVPLRERPGATAQA